MYISDVIKRAKALHPSEYTIEEYIHWCDELSADVRKNYDIVYDKITCTGKEVLLPEGVSINEISKIVVDKKELKKTDLRDYGIEYEYQKRGRTLSKTTGNASEFEIVFMVPHTPVRYINEDSELTFFEGGFTSSLPLSEGDFVKITDNDVVFDVYITDVVADGFRYLGDELESGTRVVHVLRELTDQTLIPAPYDSAYIDFVNAKVSLYQGDEYAYKNFIEQYNEKMRDYRAYLTRHMPRADRRFINWM